MPEVFLYLGEVLSEDSETADGSQAEWQQQQGTHPLPLKQFNRLSLVQQFGRIVIKRLSILQVMYICAAYKANFPL